MGINQLCPAKLLATAQIMGTMRHSIDIEIPFLKSKSFSKQIKSQIENLPTFTQKDLMNTGRVLVEILVFCIDSPIFLCIIYDYYNNKIMQSKKKKNHQKKKKKKKKKKS